MAKKKQPTDEMYVQLGKRRNGRIVKAENYELTNFLVRTLANSSLEFFVPRKPTFIERLLNLKANREYERSQNNSKIIWLFNQYCEEGMRVLINKDSFGKKKR